MQSSYRVYVTDGLQAVSENVMRICGGGDHLAKRYFDLIHPKPEDTRTPEEVTDTLRAKLAALNIGKGGE